MNRTERRRAARRRGPKCEMEVGFTDFDGRQASMPCGQHAVATVVTNTIDMGGAGGRLTVRTHVCGTHAKPEARMPLAELRQWGVEREVLVRQ